MKQSLKSKLTRLGYDGCHAKDLRNVLAAGSNCRLVKRMIEQPPINWTPPVKLVSTVDLQIFQPRDWA
jgi:hypothetical protein